VSLAPKEGLALINGTQASTALLALALAGAEQLARGADVIAALTVDALLGSRRPFDPRIHAPRAFDGQAKSADNLWRLIDGSPLNASHAGCGRVQDAYSERCVPQVHGAAREALAWIRHVVMVEMNAATDNPMVFAADAEIVSGGNFHGAPVALAADLLAMAVTQLATISERRSERLVNPALSGLPAFLTRHGGLQSGLMLAQVTAAALTSELKTLCHAASADTIPTSANKEDHVSMSMGRGAQGRACVTTGAPGALGRNALRLPGDRSARAPGQHARADGRARRGSRGGSNLAGRSFTIARHRRDHRIVVERRARVRHRDSCQLIPPAFSI
jgi:histidine ammonia-lyase